MSRIQKLRELINTCTRQSPHICRVNGPCNGWPKPEGLNPPIHCALGAAASRTSPHRKSHLRNPLTSHRME
jgi:hypothetical protein